MMSEFENETVSGLYTYVLEIASLNKNCEKLSVLHLKVLSLSSNTSIPSLISFLLLR